ncbi:MAG: hypothetical protein OQJ96_12085, partial [Flavobacteriales bacterium]|nr:hypothetical protein [Flavobacteriales bacterium]MCW8913883.1 hypothetical protein [Flavobacteriales bacterium]MCW8937448.1 hypothetical protein [Flavobacteriales bacterium]MCW8939544.1 hypothetical protein [Flavobacteriales bacterium]MCW8969074.1 hypothetical protein [Flavobacteriales bacterium]
GKNSISIVTPEPTGINCQNGGNKIDVGTDDNGDNILQPLEIDFTYYVCNGDSGATGLGVNWLGNGTNFPPAPNNENDAFYHSTNNTSYIYNGTTWDTLVSGNVGSAGFWSQSGNTIYNNNNSNSGNVSIGSTLSLSKLTVASTDSTIASFIGNDPNIAVVSVINANTTGSSGVAFVNGSNSNAYIGYSPSNKTLSVINGVTDGHIFINSDSTIVNQTLVIANQAQKIANQAQTAIYNNTDTIYNYSSTGPIINANSGSFLTDSLYVLGNNFLNTNWILANDGTGQAKWTDPNTLGLGNDNWGTQVVISDATLNGNGTAANPLGVNGVLTDNQDLSLTGNTLSLTNDPTPVDLSPYLDNTDAQTLSINANILSISNGNTVTLPSSPWTKTGTTLHPAIIGDNVGIGTVNPTNKLHITNNVTGHITKIENTNVSGPSSISFQDNLAAEMLFIGYANTSYSLFPGNSFINSVSDLVIGTQNTERMRINTAGNVGIGTSTPLAKLHVEENASAVMMLKEVVPTNGAAFVMESMNQYVLLSNESGTFRIENATNSLQPFNINPSGQVGIGGNAFHSALDVHGKITMRNGATNGYIPVSDANGTMTWTDPNTVLTLPTALWSLNGTDIYNNNSGNVGIGTSAPNVALHIQGTNTSTTLNAYGGSPETALRLFNTDMTPNNFSSIAFTTMLSNSASAEMGKIVVQNVNHTIGSVQGDMVFMTRNSSNLNEVMRITGNSNVGIRTTTPTMNLHIGGTNGIMINAASSTGNIGGLAFREGYTTIARPFHLGIVTYDHSSGGTGFSDGLVVSGYDGIAFTTDNSATSTTTLSNVRMFINQAGNVGIGTSTPSQKLDVDGGGSIEVDGEYTYETPKTHYYSVAGNSFVGTREGLDLWNASLNLIYGQWSSGSGTYPIAVAPINLPDDAVITDVTAYIYDNDGTITYQPRIYLYTIYMATGSYGIVGSGTLPGNSASTTPQALSITTNHTVNNQNAYYLKFQSEGNAGSNIRLYGVRITYTVNKAD